MSSIPDDFKYTDSHEWLQGLDDGSVRVGITDHAQEQLGDLVFVELPLLNQTFSSGDECAVVESVKSASDLYMPLTGEIISVNEALNDGPEAINEDPYGSGWIFQIMPANASEIEGLLDADAYSAFVEEED